MANVKYPGIPVRIGGQEYLVPSLTLRQFRANYEALATPTGDLATLEAIDARYKTILPVILIALQNNYPEMTLDDLYDGITLDNFALVLGAVNGASGMRSMTLGE
jgi:hypothetical protein